MLGAFYLSWFSALWGEVVLELVTVMLSTDFWSPSNRDVSSPSVGNWAEGNLHGQEELDYQQALPGKVVLIFNLLS